MRAHNANVAEPLGGKPPDGETRVPASLTNQFLRHRAMEAVLWSMPAVSVHGFIRGSASCGGGPNSLIQFSQHLSAMAELLTPDVFYPRFYGFTDLRHGPVVVSVPPDSKSARLCGQFVDHWQCPVVAIAGGDQGQSLLLLPPGYSSDVPDGFVPVPSPSYRLVWAIRSVPGAGATWDHAAEHARNLEIYYLETPKPTEFIEPLGMRFPTLPRYDERWFLDLNDIIQIEPGHRRDAVMIQILASLSLQKGKPFKPDARTLAAMRHGAIDAYFHMHGQVFGSPGHATGHCASSHDERVGIQSNLCCMTDEAAFTDANRLNFDDRALRFFTATFSPEFGSTDVAPRYAFLESDSAGNPLEPNATYTLTLPAERLQRQDWSIAVYDRDTCAFIYAPSGRNALSFRDLGQMIVNADGSATVYLGSRCPDGRESNWIDSCGKHMLPCLITLRQVGILQDDAPQPPCLHRMA